MAVQLSVAARNASLDSFEVTTGTAAILEMRTGSKPVTCATADSGTLLSSLTLPSDWMAAASGGTKALSGTWLDLSADNNGTIAHFRIKDSGGTTCHMQGTVTLTGSGGDITVNLITLVTGQAFAITAFTLTAGNA